jgi:DNA-binding NarL/FixJ family response regulator
MPGMSGRELAEQVIERSPATRIIFTSGYPDDSSIHALIDQRHIAFIQKPYAGTEMLATIREALA